MPTLQDTLAKVRAGADQRDASHRAEYLALVGKCARGADVVPEKVLAQLDKWGRDVVQFQKDVEDLAHRLDLAATVAKLEGRRGALADAQSREAEAAAEYEREASLLRQKALAVLSPIRASIAVLEVEITAGEAARVKLAATAPDDVKAEVAEARARYDAARLALERAQQQPAQLEAGIQTQKERIQRLKDEHKEHRASYYGNPDQQRVQDDILKRDLPPLEEGLAGFESRRAKLPAELEAARLAVAAATAAAAKAEAKLYEV